MEITNKELEVILNDGQVGVVVEELRKLTTGDFELKYNPINRFFEGTSKHLDYRFFRIGSDSYFTGEKEYYLKHEINISNNDLKLQYEAMEQMFKLAKILCSFIITLENKKTTGAENE